jgi:hypothetical protein
MCRVHGTGVKEPVEFGVLGIFPTGTVRTMGGSFVREERSIRIDIERRNSICLYNMVDGGHPGSGGSGQEIGNFGPGKCGCSKSMIYVTIINECGVGFWYSDGGRKT